jgi:hypothetical protein
LARRTKLVSLPKSGGNMGKQIRFYTLSGDEGLFLDFIESFREIKLIASHTNTPGIRVLDRSLLNLSKDIDLREILVWPSSMEIQPTYVTVGRRKIYDEKLMSFIKTDEMIYSFSVTDAPVIQFNRSFIRDDGKLVQGRLWCELSKLRDGKLEYKGSEFEKIFDSLSKWISQNFYREKNIDGYFGINAFDWFRKGGIIFP